MNDAAPLAQLRDIHTPLPIDWWPPAPGWWLLLLLATALVIAASVWVLQRYRGNAYRRSARAELMQHYHNWQQHGDGLAYLQSANSILKRTTMLRYKKSAVQSLSGAQWCEFLDRHWARPRDAGFAHGPFTLAVYSNSEPTAADIASLHALADSWLCEHRGEKC